MEKQVVTKPAYRKVVAKLADCEERYSGLVESLSETQDSRLETALETLKKEVELRRQLEFELLGAVEGERQRIGQDLHDDLCQLLGAAALQAGFIAKKISVRDPQLGEQAAKIPTLINEAIANCRDLAQGLHPVTLAASGLPSALAELGSRLPLDVQFQWPHSKKINFEPTVALHLYRIAEEAVGNAVKHSGAKSIIIKLEVCRGQAILAISDNGKGFGRQLKAKGMGLRNMQYRSHVIGGKLTITGLTNGGTCVSCVLPFDSESGLAQTVTRAPNGITAEV
jgi:two-component system sensor kinase FixL